MIAFPLLAATEFRLELTSGATRPCVFSCEDPQGGSSEYVVKMRGGVRDSGLAFEYVAAQLAHHFSIPMPDPALIHITVDLAIAQKHNKDLYDRILRSVGLGFGTRYLPGKVTWLPGRHVPGPLLQAATNMLAFDALIDNADRRVDKPNLLTDAETIWAIDHELAFSFVRLIHVPSAWSERLQFLRIHPFYESLRGRDLDLGAFRSKLESLSDAMLDDICASMPDEFGRQLLDRISGHLRLVRLDSESFLQGIQGAVR